MAVALGLSTLSRRLKKTFGGQQISPIRTSHPYPVGHSTSPRCRRHAETTNRKGLYWPTKARDIQSVTAPADFVSGSAKSAKQYNQEGEAFMTKTLVILGAGIGGLTAIHELRQRNMLDSSDLEVILIDPDFTHFQGFTLPWIMRGWRTTEQAALTPTQHALNGVHTITGTVTTIDTERKKVLGDHFDANYDALIVAAGARNNSRQVPGLAEAVDAGVAHHFYSISDADQAHHALTNFVGGKIAVLVPSLPYRCPVAPYEGAMLAHDYLLEHGKRTATQIDIFTVEPQPMPSAGDGPGKKLIALLGDAQISFHPNMQCRKVDASGRMIHFEGGATAPFDLLLFVPPHEPAVGLDGPGWITVDPETLATQHEGVWAVGDITSITTPSGRPLPKAAIMAKGHAKTAVGGALKYLGLASDISVFDGHGYCFIDTGNHESARGIGDFYALPDPEVELVQPSRELHQLKQQEEREWIDLWSA